MSDPSPVSAEALAQIRALDTSDAPLIICDVDEVVLHMIRHLEDYLLQQGLCFIEHKYRLTGNIAERGSHVPVAEATVKHHLHAFFDDRSGHQDMVDGADLALKDLASEWDIIFLTNLPGAHNKPIRERVLAEVGLPFPVVTNSGPKGGAASALSAGRRGPIAFIDDSPGNLKSVQASLPAAHLVHFIADERFLANSEDIPGVRLKTGDWRKTADYLGSIL